MKRFEDENIRLWKFFDATAVKCPNCGKQGVVKQKVSLEKCPKCGDANCPNRRVFECSHCFHSITESKTLYEVYAKVYCSGCFEKYEVTAEKTSKEVETLKVRCPHCKHQETVKPKLKAVEAEFKLNAKMAAEPYFDLELWYQQEFKGNLFWALNREHMDYLERYIAADLRERNAKGNGGLTLVARLPKFVKEAKNRDRLLKIIEKWKR
ncbi:hypothetical protein [Flavobacterium pedocola]